MTEGPVPNQFRKLFFGLFIFPLVIAVGMAILLCSVVFLTHERQSPDSLVLAIKTGAPSKRWQKAFELSNELNRDKNALRAESTLREIIAILGDSTRYDAKTRGYMAIALGRVNHPESAAALKRALNDDSEDVRLYALWALGNLREPDLAKNLLPFFNEESAQLRKMAVYLAGVTQDTELASSLRQRLQDPIVDVQWNAALALARLGDSSGLRVLLSLLDRETYQPLSMNESQIEATMINAAKGLALLKSPESLVPLQQIAKQDKNLKVRQAALEALQHQGTLNPS